MTPTGAPGPDGERYHTLGVDAASMDGFAAIELDDGELIVYDIDAEEGWIQSTDWIGLEFMA